MKSNQKKVEMKIKKQITKKVLMATVVVLSGIALCACQKEEVEVASSPIAVEQDANDKVSKTVNEVVETPKAIIKEVEETTKQADNTVNVASAEIIPEYDIVKEVEIELSEEELGEVLKKYKNALFQYAHQEVKGIKEVKQINTANKIGEVTKYKIHDNLDFYNIVNVGGDKVIPPSKAQNTSSQDTPPQTVVNQEVANQQQEMEAYIAAQQEYERQQQAAQQAQSTTPPPQSGNITWGADGKPVGDAKPGTVVTNPTTGVDYIYSSFNHRWEEDHTKEELAEARAKKEYTNGLSQEEIQARTDQITLNVN